jgi:hypothetical protein
VVVTFTDGRGLITNKDKMESIMFTHVTPKNAKSRTKERFNADQ